MDLFQKNSKKIDKHKKKWTWKRLGISITRVCIVVSHHNF